RPLPSTCCWPFSCWSSFHWLWRASRRLRDGDRARDAVDRHSEVIDGVDERARERGDLVLLLARVAERAAADRAVRRPITAADHRSGERSRLADRSVVDVGAAERSVGTVAELRAGLARRDRERRAAVGADGAREADAGRVTGRADVAGGADTGRGIAIGVGGAGRADLGRLARRAEVGAEIADAGRGIAIGVGGAGRADLARVAGRAEVGASQIAEAGLEGGGVRAAGRAGVAGPAGRAEVGARIADAGVEAVGVRGAGMVHLVGATGGAAFSAPDSRRRARARPGGAGAVVGEELPSRRTIGVVHALERRPALAVVVIGGEVRGIVDVQLVLRARVEIRHRAAADDVLVPVADVLAERHALIERRLEELTPADELGRVREREVEVRVGVVHC